MFNTVLLPVDLSNPNSVEPALQQASEFVKSSSGTLHVISIVPDFGTAMVGNFFPKDFEKEALQRAEEALGNFRRERIDSEIETKLHLVYGPVAEKILTTAQDIGADLIVMGSHDPERVRDFLIGTNADRVVRHSTISVLIARG